MPLLPAAIAIILNEDKTEVLLVKRRDVPIWTLPGGGVEPSETFEEALKREVLEETGYEVEIESLCAEYTPINFLSAPTKVYRCLIRSGEQKISSETAAICFCPLSALPSTFFYVHREWLKEILTSSHLIKRALKEISYGALFKFLLRHPWQTICYAWTRFTQSS